MRIYARISLYYLATYLFLTGLAFLFAPDFSLSLLLSNRHYDDVFVRFTGAFMIALSIVVSQIIRHRIDVLYPTTLAVRIFFIAVIIGLYWETRDPLFLVILGVVGLGVALTASGLIVDAGRARKS